MKKLLSIATMLFLFGNIFTSCEKSNFEQEISSTISDKKSVVFPINTETVELIGQMHNDYCLEVINSFKSNSKKITLKDAIMGLDVKGLSYDEKLKIYNSMSILSEQQIEENLTNWFTTENGLSMFRKITNVVENATDYPNLENSLNILKKEVEQKTKNIQEKQVLDVYIEVSKKSAYLWFPISLGGSGLGDDYINASNQQRRSGWVKADGQAAGQAMISWALTGGLGGPIGFIGSTVVGAVLGSVSHGK